MTLRLSVVSEHGIRLGVHSTKVFGIHGGSIGRGSDNAWILPDPERYLSGKHARIDFRAGSYVLVDTSSNGTYVNGSQLPLGKYHDYTLKDGDYVRLGEYEFLVSIDKGNDFPPDASAIVAYDGRAASSSAARKSTANDLGADLDLSALLEPSDRLDLSSEPRARDSYGQPITPDTDAAAATPWHMMTRPLRVDGKPAAAGVASGVPADASGSFPSLPAPPAARAAGTPLLFDGDLEVGLAALCRGAGIDARNIPHEVRATALKVAGQMLRECLLGVLELTQSRNEFANRFRVSAQADDAPESLLNFSGGVDDALVRLLTNPSSRASSVDAIRDKFKELKAQNVAALQAMSAAFEAFIERVDPKALEERFDAAAKRGMFGTANKGKYWELYGEMFPGLVQRPSEGFPHLYSEAFARAYEAKLRALLPPRRSAFGGERDEPAHEDDKVGNL
jgi:type VI secretion system FHA domain protein